MKVLFTHSYFLRFDPKQWETAMPYPPLGTLYAAAVLRSHGFEVDLHDTMFARHADEVRSHLLAFRPDIFVVYDDGFNYLTKMCLTNMREAAFRMQRLASDLGCLVLVSSSDATDHAAAYLDSGADAVIKGEAEQTLLEVCTRYRDGSSDFTDIPGLMLPEGRKGPAITPPRAVVRDLDSLPLPAWDLVDIRPYKEMWMEHHGYFSINLVTTRGCPYKCNWCAKPIYGNRYNSHSPSRIAGQMKFLRDTFGAQHIWFADDIFGLKPGWMQSFRAELDTMGVHLPYKIQTRADLLLQDDAVRLLGETGCETAWMGAESGSQRILDAMDKGTSVAQIREASSLLRKHGIRPAFFIQFGYLGETMQDIRATIDLILELMPDDIGISVSYPLPGTGFYEKVRHELGNKANWTDSDDLDLMFTGTYSREFYKELHRYVHRLYRSRQSWQRLKQGRSVIRNLVSLPYHRIQAFRHRNALNHLEPDAASCL